MTRGVLLATALVCAAVLLTACAREPRVNPSFDLSFQDAKAALGVMAERPLPLARPVVVLSGWGDLGPVVAELANTVRDRVTDPSQVLATAFFSTASFDGSARRVIDLVDARFPSPHDDRTTTVDVVAISMGGLVARHAAANPLGSRGARLDIATLYTIASPHRGAQMASTITLDKRVRDMVPGSDFLNQLDDAYKGPQRDYPIVAYVRLGDGVVGAENATPPRGAGPLFWIDTPWYEQAHLDVPSDERIVADILRRLRQETPFTTPPPEPLPATPGTPGTPGNPETPDLLEHAQHAAAPTGPSNP